MAHLQILVRGGAIVIHQLLLSHTWLGWQNRLPLLHIEGQTNLKKRNAKLIS